MTNEETSASDPADVFYTALGQRLRAAREALGLNQAALGAVIGIGRSSVSNVEAGRQRLAVHQLVAAAQALGLGADDLLTGPLPDLRQPSPLPSQTARPFWLQRNRDVTGVSGTGVVAHGALWPDGTASVRWVGPRPSTVFWDSIEDAEAVHGHGGHTRIVFASEDTDVIEATDEIRPGVYEAAEPHPVKTADRADEK